MLYYNKIIDIKKIIQVRDHAFGGFYRDWLQSNNYNINELERILLGGNSSSQAEKWFRWGLVSVTGLILPAVGGLAVSLLNEKFHHSPKRFQIFSSIMYYLKFLILEKTGMLCLL